MAYVKNTWVDQAGQVRYTETEDDGYKIFTPNYDEVTELGTPVNAVNMNHIEDGIVGCAIRKYNVSETFNLGEWVLGEESGDEATFYVSQIPNNTGNALSDTTKWLKKDFGSSRNIGEIVASTIPLTDAGLHLLDGSLLQYGSYKAFIDYIANLYSSNPSASYFCTEAQWQQSVTEYGVCGKFVYNSVNQTVRLPKITGFTEGTITPSSLGSLTEAGLPNIAGYVGDSLSAYAGNRESGALYRTTGTGTAGYSTGGSGGWTTNIDASRSSSIYGNSNTVQPQSIKVLYYIVVATSTKTQIQVDIDQIATDLNGKADVDLSNVNNTGNIAATNLNTAGIRTVVETYSNGTSWYRVWSDKWCEQGGYAIENTTVIFLKPFADSNYGLSGMKGTETSGAAVAYESQTSTSVIFRIGADFSGDKPLYWQAWGYIS